MDLYPKTIGFAFCFLLLFSSCYNYKPAYINSPKFENKGQLNADVNVGSSFGGNLAYSPIKHWAVIANYSVDFDKFNADNSGDSLIDQSDQLREQYRYKNYFLEGAIGTYWNYDENVYQDFYLGYGKGVASKINPVLSRSPNGEIVAFQNDFQNVFIQSSFHFTANKTIDIGIHARINFLSFSNFKYVYQKSYPYDSLSIQQYPRKEDIDNYFWGENRIAYQLGLSITTKFEYFNLYYQFQLGIPEYGYKNRGDFFNVRTFNSFVGVSVPLNQFWQD